MTIRSIWSLWLGARCEKHFSPLKWASPARIFWWRIPAWSRSPPTKETAAWVSSLPRIHVAVTGIEKVIPRAGRSRGDLAYAGARGGGQSIACYNTLIGGPRTVTEPDGPEEFHVVLLDNGRSELLADAEQRDVLHCVRCGACLNVCPVFRKVGGHTYGTVYGGPIGSVLMPHLRWTE